MGAASLSSSPSARCGARAAVRRCGCCCPTRLEVACALSPIPLLGVSDGFTYCNATKTVAARRQMQTPKAKVRHQGDQHLPSPPLRLLLLWLAAAAAADCWGLPRGMPRETTACCCCACDGLLAEGARRRSGPMLAVATDDSMVSQAPGSSSTQAVVQGVRGAGAAAAGQQPAASSSKRTEMAWQEYIWPEPAPAESSRILVSVHQNNQSADGADATAPLRQATYTDC